MKTLVKLLLLAVSTTALSQVPAPQVPVTGNIGAGGNFPLLNSGNLIFASDADHTMVYPEMSASFIKVTSSVSLTAQRNLIAPLTSGFAFTIKNSTSGGQAVQVIGISGAGVVVPNGSTVTVVCDGANYINTATSGSGLPVNNPTFTGALNGPQIGQTFVANSSTTGADWCAKVSTAQTAAIAAGSNVVDATSLTGAQSCAASLTTGTGVVVLVANATITLASGQSITPGQNSYLVGRNRQTSQIIGNVNGGCVIQMSNSGAYLAHLTVQNNSSTANSCDVGTSAVNESGHDLFLNNGYDQLYLANTNNAYYQDFRNIYFGNSAASAYNSVLCGNATYQCNETKLDHLVLMQGSHSCVDNEGSQGVHVVNPDCEGSAGAAFIVNEAGGAEPTMLVEGGYVQNPSGGVCATLNNGFLTMIDVYTQACNPTNGTSPSNYIAIGNSVHQINGSGSTLTPATNGKTVLSSSGTSTGYQIHPPAGPDMFLEYASSDELLVGDINNSYSTFLFEVYGGLTNAYGTIIPYWELNPAVGFKTIAGTGAPSDVCSALGGYNGVIEINQTPTYYQCSNATGSYQWNLMSPASSTRGLATLVSGTVTVVNAAACSPSSSCAYKLTNCGTNSSVAVGTPTIGTTNPGTSFIINSVSSTNTVVTVDVSNVCWQIN